MNEPLDFAASVFLLIAFAILLVVHAVTSRLAGARLPERLEREAPLPVVGKAPMAAVYGVVTRVARALRSVGISANVVTFSSLVVAAGASVLFALGHFGLGAVVALVAVLADIVDGAIAREENAGEDGALAGQLLDTVVDRYVDAFVLGGIAIFVRQTPALLALVLLALVGSFMVSYASSIVRAVGATDTPSRMRRAERWTWLIAAAVFVPIVARFEPSRPWVPLVPIALSLAVIAVVGNASALKRLVHASGVSVVARK